jgi:2-iminobutanoate/2-iminopropanoate deaminase
VAWKKEVIRAPASDVRPTRVGSSAHAVRFGPLLFVTGQSGRRLEDPEYSTDPVEQARQCLDNIGAILRAAGSSYEHVLKRTIIVRDRHEYDAVRPVIEEYFTSPVASSIIESGLLRDEQKALEIEVIAGVPDGEDGAAGDAAP